MSGNRDENPCPRLMHTPNRMQNVNNWLNNLTPHNQFGDLAILNSSIAASDVSDISSAFNGPGWVGTSGGAAAPTPCNGNQSFSGSCRRCGQGIGPNGTLNSSIGSSSISRGANVASGPIPQGGIGNRSSYSNQGNTPPRPASAPCPRNNFNSPRSDRTDFSQGAVDGILAEFGVVLTPQRNQNTTGSPGTGGSQYSNASYTPPRPATAPCPRNANTNDSMNTTKSDWSQGAVGGILAEHNVFLTPNRNPNMSGGLRSGGTPFSNGSYATPERNLNLTGSSRSGGGDMWSPISNGMYPPVPGSIACSYNANNTMNTSSGSEWSPGAVNGILAQHGVFLTPERNFNMTGSSGSTYSDPRSTPQRPQSGQGARNINDSLNSANYQFSQSAVDGILAEHNVVLTPNHNFNPGTPGTPASRGPQHSTPQSGQGARSLNDSLNSANFQFNQSAIDGILAEHNVVLTPNHNFNPGTPASRGPQYSTPQSGQGARNLNDSLNSANYQFSQSAVDGILAEHNVVLTPNHNFNPGTPGTPASRGPQYSTPQSGQGARDPNDSLNSANYQFNQSAIDGILAEHNVVLTPNHNFNPGTPGTPASQYSNRGNTPQSGQGARNINDSLNSANYQFSQSAVDGILAEHNVVFTPNHNFNPGTPGTPASRGPQYSTPQSGQGAKDPNDSLNSANYQFSQSAVDGILAEHNVVLTPNHNFNPGTPGTPASGGGGDMGSPPRPGSGPCPRNANDSLNSANFQFNQSAIDGILAEHNVVLTPNHNFNPGTPGTPASVGQQYSNTTGSNKSGWSPNSMPGNIPPISSSTPCPRNVNNGFSPGAGNAFSQGYPGGIQPLPGAFQAPRSGGGDMNPGTAMNQQNPGSYDPNMSGMSGLSSVFNPGSPAPCRRPGTPMNQQNPGSYDPNMSGLSSVFNPGSPAPCSRPGTPNINQNMSPCPRASPAPCSRPATPAGAQQTSPCARVSPAPCSRPTTPGNMSGSPCSQNMGGGPQSLNTSGGSSQQPCPRSPNTSGIGPQAFNMNSPGGGSYQAPYPRSPNFQPNPNAFPMGQANNSFQASSLNSSGFGSQLGSPGQNMNNFNPNMSGMNNMDITGMNASGVSGGMQLNWPAEPVPCPLPVKEDMKENEFMDSTGYSSMNDSYQSYVPPNFPNYPNSPGQSPSSGGPPPIAPGSPNFNLNDSGIGNDSFNSSGSRRSSGTPESPGRHKRCKSPNKPGEQQSPQGQQFPQGGQQSPQGQQFPQGGQQFPQGQQMPQGASTPPGQQSPQQRHMSQDSEGGFIPQYASTVVGDPLNLDQTVGEGLGGMHNPELNDSIESGGSWHPPPPGSPQFDQNVSSQGGGLDSMGMPGLNSSSESGPVSLGGVPSTPGSPNFIPPVVGTPLGQNLDMSGGTVGLNNIEPHSFNTTTSSDGSWQPPPPGSPNFDPNASPSAPGISSFPAPGLNSSGASSQDPNQSSGSNYIPPIKGTPLGQNLDMSGGAVGINDIQPQSFNTTTSSDGSWQPPSPKSPNFNQNVSGGGLDIVPMPTLNSSGNSSFGGNVSFPESVAAGDGAPNCFLMFYHSKP